MPWTSSHVQTMLDTKIWFFELPRDGFYIAYAWVRLGMVRPLRDISTFSIENGTWIKSQESKKDGHTVQRTTQHEFRGLTAFHDLVQYRASLDFLLLVKVFASIRGPSLRPPWDIPGENEARWRLSEGMESLYMTQAGPIHALGRCGNCWRRTTNLLGVWGCDCDGMGFGRRVIPDSFSAFYLSLSFRAFQRAQKKGHKRTLSASLSLLLSWPYLFTNPTWDRLSGFRCLPPQFALLVYENVATTCYAFHLIGHIRLRQRWSRRSCICWYHSLRAGALFAVLLHIFRSSLRLLFNFDGSGFTYYDLLLTSTLSSIPPPPKCMRLVDS